MKTKHLISRILYIGKIYDQETDDTKKEKVFIISVVFLIIAVTLYNAFTVGFQPS